MTTFLLKNHTLVCSCLAIAKLKLDRGHATLLEAYDPNQGDVWFCLRIALSECSQVKSIKVFTGPGQKLSVSTGYKGSMTTDPGYFYAPYIPLEKTIYGYGDFAQTEFIYNGSKLFRFNQYVLEDPKPEFLDYFEQYNEVIQTWVKNHDL